MTYTIHHESILDYCARYDGPRYHALLCDAPYHLTSIVNRFGAEDAAPAKPGTDGAFGRLSKGFMGKNWDGGDLAFRPETWAAMGDLLYPGAFGMAFASSRGWHRMAVAIEDAGFIIHPTIFCWTQGSGFPKATHIKGCNCAERGQSVSPAKWSGCDLSGMRSGEVQTDGMAQKSQEPLLFTQLQGEGGHSADLDGEQARSHGPEIPGLGIEGGQESGMEGGGNVQAEQGQLHRPALRAMSSRVSADGAQGRLHHGASAGHGDADRSVPESDGSHPSSRPQHPKQSHRQSGAVAGQRQPQNGRGREDCPRCGLPIVDDWEGHRYGLQAMKPAIEPIIVFQRPYVGRPVDCITRTGAGALNIDAGRIPTDGRPLRESLGNLGSQGIYRDGLHGSRADGETDLGRWPANFVAVHTPGCDDAACADGCPVASLDAQSGTSVSSDHTRANGEYKSVAKGRDLPHATVGISDEGGASRFFHTPDWNSEVAEGLLNRDPVRYVPKASQAERESGLGGDGTGRRNTHPTIKPIALNRWLASLLLPPAHYAPGRRLLVPFSGAGSEMIGALHAGWDHIDGVELEAEYVALAEQRLRYWSGAAMPAPIKRTAADGPQLSFLEAA
jgi:hypothetical protein